jgi:hypothetical protein
MFIELEATCELLHLSTETLYAALKLCRHILFHIIKVPSADKYFETVMFRRLFFDR